MREAAAAGVGPPEGVRDALVSVYAALGDAATAANHLGQLGVDLGDPELRQLLGEHYAALERELCELVRLAAGPGWRGPRPDLAARTLLSVANGAALGWSIRPHGSLADRLAADIESIVEGWYA
jgi:hypothetical protein